MNEMSVRGTWYSSHIALAAVLTLSILAVPSHSYADRYDKLVKKGSHYVGKGKLDKALEVFKEAVREDPGEIWGYFNVANIARKLKDCRNEILYFRGFLHLSPGTSDDKVARRAIKGCVGRDDSGTISVVTEPSDIDIVIDGVVVGQTPQPELGLTSGDYAVDLMHPDCEPLSRQVTVKGGETTFIKETLKMKPAFGYLDVVVEPAEGVRVYLDEAEIGVAPLKQIRLETKKYLLKLEKDGYDLWVRYVTIQKEKTHTLRATMEKSEAPKPAKPSDR